MVVGSVIEENNIVCQQLIAMLSLIA